MSEHALDVGLADFAQHVLEESKRRPVVVDFWAPWCGPCKSLKPILEKLAAEYGGKFLLAKINSDENQELAARYGVRGIPSVKAFIGGEPVDEFSGVPSRDLLTKSVSNLSRSADRRLYDRRPSPQGPCALDGSSMGRCGGG